MDRITWFNMIQYGFILSEKTIFGPRKFTTPEDAQDLEDNHNQLLDALKQQGDFCKRMCPGTGHQPSSGMGIVDCVPLMIFM